MNRLRGVMIGAGFFANFQAEAWKRLPGVTITAVADLAPCKASEFALMYGIPRHYESVEAMLDAESPDFVDIVTRPETHLALTRLCTQHGAHVICQKPMAPTMAECVAMCESAEAAGVRLLIHENWRWQPWYCKVKRLIESGALGTPRRLSFDWRTGDGNGPEPYSAQPYFRKMPRLLIYESLIHILDTFRYLAGELQVTACKTRQVNPAIMGEDWAEIHCTFINGAEGFIHGDRQTGSMPPRVAMGSLTIETERTKLRVGDDGRLFRTQPGAQEERFPYTPKTIGYKGDSVFAAQKHFYDCLVKGQPSVSEGREYLKTMALVEQCYILAQHAK